MVTIFLVGFCPWCYWTSMDWRDYAQFGEWAWVGRDYEVEQG